MSYYGIQSSPDIQHPQGSKFLHFTRHQPSSLVIIWIFLIVARARVELAAFLGLSLDGLPIAYRASYCFTISIMMLSFSSVFSHSGQSSRPVPAITPSKYAVLENAFLHSGHSVVTFTFVPQFFIVAQVGFEPTASELLKFGGLPIAYCAISS